MTDDLPRFGSGERGVFRYEDGRLVRVERSEAPRLHYVITDSMEPIEYLGNAKREMFDSKSAYKRRLERDGYRETGGPVSTRPVERPDDLRDDIERAYHDIKYDRVPLSDREREACKREEKAYREYRKRNWNQ